MINLKQFFLNELPNSNNKRALLEAELENYKNNPDQQAMWYLYNSKNLLQNKYHSEDLFTHLVSTYEIGMTLIPNSIFGMACLFHDIGKVPTRKFDEEKQDWTYHRHEYIGALEVANWMYNNKFESEDILRVKRAIQNHQYRIYQDTKDKTIISWLKKIGQQTWEDIRILRLADRMANKSNDNKPIIYQLYIETDNRINSFASEVFQCYN